MNANIASASTQISPYELVLQKARSQQLSLPDLFKVAEALNGSGKGVQAAEVYKVWIAFNDSHPLLHVAYFNYSVTLKQNGDPAGAINALRAAVAKDPQFGQAHINLGRALEDYGLIGQAVQQWRTYTELTSETTPDRLSNRLMTIQHIGRVLENAGKLEEAESAMWQAIELQPTKPEAGQHWSAIRQRLCKWPLLSSSPHVTKRQLLDAMSPLTLSCFTDDPIFQLAKAYRYNRQLVGTTVDLADFPRKAPKQKSGTGQKLRVGYLSSDLRDHAVGFALREVLELHDKSNVEIYAYYCGEPRTNDPTQDRIKAAADAWRNIATMSDIDAAKLIRADEVDILVDVNGYTKMARTKIFAYRPAPVIVNFCGYPGTMASPFHQYMIADPQIVPEENEAFYTEKVLRIACNQPLDRKRIIDAKPSRAEAGLPEDAFVFACFNGMQKITGEVFGRWMEILKATPGSLLWLLSGDDDANKRLVEEAEKKGIPAERIVFAPKAPNAKHLARIAVADLFLDTYPYGAHSTAADAITVGLPILTLAGNGFASRFCSSIVVAAGIPEMICATPDDYVARAIGFAKDRQSLAAVRASLQAQRETSALRDIPGLARRLEELFWQMQGECERGEAPVPDLRNLELYYEVGADLVLEGIEFEDRETYLARYRAKLAHFNEYAAIPHDNRLWPAPRS